MSTSIMIRPDEITRTGVIQPYNIISQTAGQQAQTTIRRFIDTARPEGAHVGLGFALPTAPRRLGQEEKEEGMPTWVYALAAFIGGVVFGIVVAKSA